MMQPRELGDAPQTLRPSQSPRPSRSRRSVGRDASALIGILGGMSPESTLDYYQRIQAGVREELGGLHAARMVIHSVDLQRIFDWLKEKDYEALGDHLIGAAKGLEASGAEFVLMACNTVHLVAPRLEAALDVPFLHIADVLGEALQGAGLSRVGMLATRVTAEAPFYSECLSQRFAVQTLIPDLAHRKEVDRIILEELCFHRILPESRNKLEQIAESLRAKGADSIALACTELGLLAKESHLGGLPVFDTTALHTRRAVDLALASQDLPNEACEGT